MCINSNLDADAPINFAMCVHFNCLHRQSFVWLRMGNKMRKSRSRKAILNTKLYNRGSRIGFALISNTKLPLWDIWSWFFTPTATATATHFEISMRLVCTNFNSSPSPIQIASHTTDYLFYWQIVRWQKGHGSPLVLCNAIKISSNSIQLYGLLTLPTQ